MLSLIKPDQESLDSWLGRLSQVDFNYVEVGLTRGDVQPKGYHVDRHAVQLGLGEEAYQRALGAFRGLNMWNFPWMEMVTRDKSMRLGTELATLTQQMGVWFLMPCRIVNMIDEKNRIGFAFGTLTGHVEQGEERFLIERRQDDSVWYDIISVSRPRHWLAMLGYPYTRWLQGRFWRDSMQAMVNAVSKFE